MPASKPASSSSVKAPTPPSSSASTSPLKSGEKGVQAHGPLQEAGMVWIAGVKDALMLHQCVFFLARSEKIRYRTLQCFMLNGVIFLGSIVFFNFAIEPARSIMRRLVQEDEAWATDFIASSFSVMYKLLWIYPIYCISFVLNTLMYQEVADSALALLQHTPPARATQHLERLIHETWRVLVNAVYLLQMYLLFYVPVVGPALYFLQSCWMASIYCFEYRWVHQRWTSNARLDYFERHWLYFAGFGFPVSFVSLLCPRFIDAGVFALFFPLFVLTATRAEPKALQQCPELLRKLPLFAAVQGVSTRFIRFFEGHLGGGSKKERRR
eukprot:TRINITY_DN105660_c0_g1_i1.p1 TRINITY_DN105660_c0_g1~~TRINITY_DN105660_c0_g1_i1.p1  ORF type:complete len:334 (-),score=64.69 TRINITY_DN105660_c0_g1_i1:52-1026(-)